MWGKLESDRACPRIAQKTLEKILNSHFQLNLEIVGNNKNQQKQQTTANPGVEKEPDFQSCHFIRTTRPVLNKKFTKNIWSIKKETKNQQKLSLKKS